MNIFYGIIVNTVDWQVPNLGTDFLDKFSGISIYIDTQPNPFYTFSFKKQVLTSRTGQYALSLSCTNKEQDESVIYHRLYDILLLKVINADNFADLFDLQITVKIECVKDNQLR